MTHDEHLKLTRHHHAAAAGFHEEAAGLHRRLADHHELTDGKLSKIHDRLAGLHQAHAEHHARLEKLLADSGVETHEFGGEDLQRLAKLLGGS